MNWLTKLFQKRDAALEPIRAAEKTYKALTAKSVELLAAGKSLSTADVDKLIAAAETIGRTPERARSDVALFTKAHALRQVKLTIPALEEKLASAKLAKQTFADDTNGKVLALQRERAKRRTELLETRKQLKVQRTTAGVEAGEKIDAQITSIAGELGVFDATTARMRKDLEARLEIEHSARKLSSLTILEQLTAARAAACELEKFELANHWLFDRETPEVAAANAAREARRRHIVQDVGDYADERPAAKYPILKLEELLGGRTPISEFEFLPLEGQTQEQVDELVAIAQELALRHGPGFGHPIYLLSISGRDDARRGRLAHDLVRYIEHIETSPEHPGNFRILPFPGQSERDREKFTERWWTAWRKVKGQEGERDFANSRWSGRRIDAPSLSRR
jgi:hypothetical protein